VAEVPRSDSGDARAPAGRRNRGAIGDLASASADAVAEAPQPRLREGLRTFLRVLTHHEPRRLSLIVALQVISTLFQSAALILLIPLLGSIGVARHSSIARTIRHVFHSVGLQPTLIVILAIYVVLTALGTGLSAIQSVLATRYRLEFVDRLRTRLYSAIATADWWHLLSLRRSDVLAVLNTNVTLTGQGVQAVLAIVVAAILSISQLTVSVIVSPPLTGLSIISGLGLMAVVWPLVRRSRRLGQELIFRNRAVQALATGFLDALKLTKSYGTEDDHVTSYGRALAAVRAPQIEFARVSAMASAVQSTLRASLLAITVVVAVRVIHVPLSYLLVIALVFNRVVGLLVGVQGNIQQVAQSLPALEEVLAMITDCERASVPDVASEPLVAAPRMTLGTGVELIDVRFRYPGRSDGTEALRGVSLTIPAGSMTALAGPTGAGKTTIADLVIGLIAPSAGEARIGGQPLTRESARGWRESVSLVPQDPLLFHDTIRANLLWAKPEAPERRLWEVLRQAAVDQFVAGLPDGIDTLVGDRGLRLSGGERQRLALARALLREPELLILDEATSALDTETERSVRTALADLRGRVTMLVIAHRLTAAREADQIIVLDAGEIAERGTWEQLSQLPMSRLSSLIQASEAPVVRGHWARGRPAPARPGRASA
jgi:ATP-binding cassette, subfamily C, bacterial